MSPAGWTGFWAGPISKPTKILSGRENNRAPPKNVIFGFIGILSPRKKTAPVTVSYAGQWLIAGRGPCSSRRRGDEGPGRAADGGAGGAARRGAGRVCRDAGGGGESARAAALQQGVADMDGGREGAVRRSRGQAGGGRGGDEQRVDGQGQAALVVVVSW